MEEEGRTRRHRQLGPSVLASELKRWAKKYAHTGRANVLCDVHDYCDRGGDVLHRRSKDHCSLSITSDCFDCTESLGGSQLVSALRYRSVLFSGSATLAIGYPLLSVRLGHAHICYRKFQAALFPRKKDG